MIRSFVIALIAAQLGTAAFAAETTAPAAAMPPMPQPQKEHQWLKQFVGEWQYEAEMVMAPGQPAIKTSGTEVVRPIGDFWVTGHITGDFMGTPFNGQTTLGFSPDNSRYVSTWVDSSNPMLWTKEGTVDPTGKILTLNYEGPCPMQDGKLVKVRETVTFKSPDHRLTTSESEDNGKWTTNMTLNFRRKK